MPEENDVKRVASAKPVKRNDMSDMVHRIKAENARGREEPKPEQRFHLDPRDPSSPYHDMRSTDD